MNTRDQREHEELRRRWAAGDATEAERERCVQLERVAEAEQVYHRRAEASDPLAAGEYLFFHRRYLGDPRPRAAHGLRVCARFDCRRHFEPMLPKQELCQRCADAAAGLDTSPADLSKDTRAPRRKATAKAPGRSRKGGSALGGLLHMPRKDPAL